MDGVKGRGVALLLRIVVAGIFRSGIGVSLALERPMAVMNAMVST